MSLSRGGHHGDGVTVTGHGVTHYAGVKYLVTWRQARDTSCGVGRANGWASSNSFARWAVGLAVLYLLYHSSSSMLIVFTTPYRLDLGSPPFTRPTPYTMYCAPGATSPGI
jgi:hypothetical protein